MNLKKKKIKLLNIKSGVLENENIIYILLKTFSESLKSLSEWSKSLDIPVAVENLDYHKGGAYEYICKPEFIKNLLNKNPV